MTPVQVFHHIEELDAFIITSEFAALSENLGLTEWTPVVWIGRLFFLDNDYGEHWFDNWDEREALEKRAAELGIDDFDLMVITPGRFQNGSDGPCNTDKMRKAFWTDVLKSLKLSYDLIFEKARQNNVDMKELSLLKDSRGHSIDKYITNLEERIAQIQATLTKT